MDRAGKSSFRGSQTSAPNNGPTKRSYNKAIVEEQSLTVGGDWRSWQAPSEAPELNPYAGQGHQSVATTETFLSEFYPTYVETPAGLPGNVDDLCADFDPDAFMSSDWFDIDKQDSLPVEQRSRDNPQFDALPTSYGDPDQTGSFIPSGSINFEAPLSAEQDVPVNYNGAWLDQVSAHREVIPLDDLIVKVGIWDRYVDNFMQLDFESSAPGGHNVFTYLIFKANA